MQHSISPWRLFFDSLRQGAVMIAKILAFLAYVGAIAIFCTIIAWR